MEYNIVFNEEKHTYHVNGKRKPCVSDILTIYDSIKYGNTPQYILYEAGERGKRVHKFTELYDCDGNFDVNEFREENQDIDGYILAVLRFYADYGNHFFVVETPFYSPEFDYCCTVDRIRLIKDPITGEEGEAIVDYKTSKKVLTLRNRIQLTLYGVAVYGIDKYLNYKYYIVHLENSSDYELIPVEPLSRKEVERLIAFYFAIKKD